MDRNYPGECPECCNCTGFLKGRTSVILTFSGITSCLCHQTGIGSYRQYITSLSLNGAFTLPLSGTSGSLTIPNACTLQIYSNPACSGTPTTALTSLVMTFNCFLNGFQVLMGPGSASGGDFFNTGGFVPLGLAQPNSWTSCPPSMVTNNWFINGTVTAS